MSTWSFADARTGLFIGRRYSGPERALLVNTPDGCFAIRGEHDPLAVQIDTGTGALIVRRDPPPADDATDWTWSEARQRWEPVASAAAVEQAARSRRGALLASSDWIVSRSAERGEDVPATWRSYRDALRDLPSQPGWPTDITWPAAPA